MGAGPQFAAFYSPMSFPYLSTVLPFCLLGIRIIEEIERVLIHLLLILCDDGQVIASGGMHTRTPLLLRMHRIGTDDAPFHQRRMDQRRSSTDLIFFALHGTLAEDDPTVALIEGSQMHCRLPLASCLSCLVHLSPVQRLDTTRLDQC